MEVLDHFVFQALEVVDLYGKYSRIIANTGGGLLTGVGEPGTLSSYQAGGALLQANGGFLNLIYSKGGKGGVWQVVEAIPNFEAKNGTLVAGAGTKLFVMGGKNNTDTIIASGAYFTTTTAYPGGSWTVMQNMITPRTNGAAVQVSILVNGVWLLRVVLIVAAIKLMI